MKDFIFGGVIVALLAATGFAYYANHQQPLGAQAGPEVFDAFYARQTITEGGNVLATTSQGSVTYTAANLKNVTVIQHTASAALTATLPASSTLSDFARTAGDVRTIYITPITTGITLAGGTGTDLNTASSTKFCVVAQICRLDFVRKTNSDFEVFLTSASGN